MPSDRYFIDSLFFPETELALEDLERHHLIDVMRTRLGETVELVNGKHQIAQAKLVLIEKKKAILQIENVYTETSSRYPLILCQAVTRLNHLEMIIEKAVELGATEIWLFPGKRSEKTQFSENQIRRLKSIITSAMKQCGRLDLPSLLFKPPLDEWGDLPLPGYFGDLSENAPPFSSAWKKNSGTCFFVGPESGFTEAEHSKLNQLGGTGVKLHSLTLRAETAAICSLSLISHWLL